MRTAPDVLFKSLADPTRRALFERLSRDGEQTVRMLTESGNISQPAVSKHLRVLKHAGMVRARHQGRETHYSAQPRALKPLVDAQQNVVIVGLSEQRVSSVEALLRAMNEAAPLVAVIGRGRWPGGRRR